LTENIHRLYPILVLAAAAVSILLALLIVALRRPAEDPSRAASSTSSPITSATLNTGMVGKMPDTNQAELAKSRVFDGRTPRASTGVNVVNSLTE
jgi:hypothetical protein